MEYGNNKSGLGMLFWTYQKGAKKRGYGFTLTKDEFRELTKGNCWYCGQEPAQIRRDLSLKSGDYYLYNGIDRVDNTKGYTPENSISCCGTCNKMKERHTVEIFLNHIRKIARNLRLSK